MSGKSATGPGRRARAAPGRLAVANALAADLTFRSARQLHASLVDDGVDVGLSTVYRALHELTHLGRADFVRDNTGERLYRHRPAHSHRHYLLCRTCGHNRPLEAGPVPHWVTTIATRAGFTDTTHTLTITGTCPTCTTA